MLVFLFVFLTRSQFWKGNLKLIGNYTRQALLHTLTVLAIFSLVSCGSDDSETSTTATITITAPGIVSPNSTESTSETQPTLTVTNASVTGGGAATHTFQIATTETFESVLRQSTGIAQGTAQTTWQPGTALNPGDYFWRAKATSGGTDGPWSSVAQFSILSGMGTGSGETLVVFDPLTEGSTLGQRFGGSLTSKGWRINNNTDFIRYEIPPISDGYVQWQNLGLTPTGGNDASHMLFGMWDPSAGDFRQNPFRVHVQKLWSNPHNPPFMRFRWISQGREHEDGINFTNWDPGQAYTFRVDWGPAAGAHRARVLRDGVEIMTIGYNKAYQLQTHYIELGIGERGESVLDAIYRNFSVVRRD